MPPEEGQVAEPVATPTATPPPSTAAPTPPAAAPSTPAADPAPAEPVTAATAPAAAEPPQAVPATWPEAWRDNLAGTNEQDLRDLKRYKEPAGVWKAYKALRTKMDSGDLLPARPDPEDEKAMAEYRTQVGAPEKAEGYYEAIKDLEIGDGDKPFLDNYFARMHKAGVTPGDVAQGVNAYYEEMAAEVEARGKLDGEQMRASEDELRANLGVEYTPRMDHMRHTLFQSGVFVQAPEGLMERIFMARSADGMTLGNNIEVLNFMLDVSGIINPDIGHTVTPVAGQQASETIQERINVLEMESGDTKGKKYDYWANPTKQAELRQLYVLQERSRRGKPA